MKKLLKKITIAEYWHVETFVFIPIALYWSILLERISQCK